MGDSDEQVARRVRQILQSRIDSGEIGGAIRRRRVGGVARKGCRKSKVVSAYKKKTGKKITAHKRCVPRKRKVVRRGRGEGEDFDLEDLLGRGIVRRKRVIKRKAPIRRKVGGLRKTVVRNPWISYVKKYAKAKGISYGEAMLKAGPSYRRLKK